MPKSGLERWQTRGGGCWKWELELKALRGEQRLWAPDLGPAVAQTIGVQGPVTTGKDTQFSEFPRGVLAGVRPWLWSEA